MRYFACLLVVLFALPAMAQDSTNEDALQSLCKLLVKHTPDADVAFTPDYDVYGNPVDSADLDGGKMRDAFALPDTFMFHITINQAEILGLPAANYLSTEEGVVGTITVTGDTVIFNDNEINGMQPENLDVLCIEKKE